jgi:hypothetical protein
MMKYTILILLLFAGSANASATFKGNAFTIKLMKSKNYWIKPMENWMVL